MPKIDLFSVQYLLVNVDFFRYSFVIWNLTWWTCHCPTCCHRAGWMSARHSCIWSAKGSSLYLICKRLIVLFIILTSIYIYYYCIVHLTSLYDIFRNIDNHHEQLLIASCEKLTWIALLHRWIDSWRSSILKGWEQNLKVSVTFFIRFLNIFSG